MPLFTLQASVSRRTSTDCHQPHMTESCSSRASTDEPEPVHHDMEYHICATGVPSMADRRVYLARVRAKPDPLLTWMGSPHRSPARRIAPQMPSLSHKRAVLVTPVVNGGDETAPVIPADSQSIPIDFDTATARVRAAIDSLNGTLDAMPSQSPRRTAPDQSASARVALLNCAQAFASASKQLVRTANTTPLVFLAPAVDRAEQMATAAQALMRQSPSLFKAQMLCAKVADVLQVMQLGLLRKNRPGALHMHRPHPPSGRHGDQLAADEKSHAPIDVTRRHAHTTNRRRARQ